MELYDSEIKARVPGSDSRAIKRIAKTRRVRMAVVIREALQDYIAKQKADARSEAAPAQS